MEFPLWHSGWRTWHCRSCGIGCSYRLNSIPDVGTSMCCGSGWKKNWETNAKTKLSNSLLLSASNYYQEFGVDPPGFFRTIKFKVLYYRIVFNYLMDVTIKQDNIMKFPSIPPSFGKASTANSFGCIQRYSLINKLDAFRAIFSSQQPWAENIESPSDPCPHTCTASPLLLSSTRGYQ